VLNLDFDYVRYLDALAADGLNHTRLFSGTYREVPASFGITDNTLAPKPGRYAAPWARGTEPGDFDGGMKFDLSRWDESYFRRLKDFMAEAARRGVIGENETGFRGRDDDLYRTERWAFLLAGGGLYNNLDYSFTPAHPDGTTRPSSSWPAGRRG
jgi:hypothetical protein